MEQHVLPCFKCGKQPESAVPDSPFSYNQPHAATVFTSRGHFGSTVFDPISRERHIELTICDDCLIENKAQVLLVKSRYQAPERDVSPWDPDVEM